MKKQRQRRNEPDKLPIWFEFIIAIKYVRNDKPRCPNMDKRGLYWVNFPHMRFFLFNAFVQKANRLKGFSRELLGKLPIRYA